MTSGYTTVGDLDGYRDVVGEGPPLVLLPGGLLTWELAFGAVRETLAETHATIAIELQGHGRTGDIDRAPTLTAMADDVAAVLADLGHERAASFGFSLGAMVALELALGPADADPPNPRMPTPEVAEMESEYQRSAPSELAIRSGAKPPDLVTSSRRWASAPR